MSVLRFTLAVAAGITPRAFAYSFFGHSLLDIGSRRFVAALVLLVALVVIPLSVRHLLNNRIRRTLPQVG